MRERDAYFDPNERRYYLALESTNRAIAEDDSERVRELKKEIIDLRITNRGEDLVIEQLKNGHEAFAEERKKYVDKLMSFNRKVGELENKLLQIESPTRATLEEGI